MIKVVPWGAGNVGKYAVQAVITHPEIVFVAHESGMVAALDLAKITGRGLYKSA